MSDTFQFVLEEDVVRVQFLKNATYLAGDQIVGKLPVRVAVAEGGPGPYYTNFEGVERIVDAQGNDVALHGEPASQEWPAAPPGFTPIGIITLSDWHHPGREAGVVGPANLLIHYHPESDQFLLVVEQKNQLLTTEDPRHMNLVLGTAQASELLRFLHSHGKAKPNLQAIRGAEAAAKSIAVDPAVQDALYVITHGKAAGEIKQLREVLNTEQKVAELVLRQMQAGARAETALGDRPGGGSQTMWKMFIEAAQVVERCLVRACATDGEAGMARAEEYLRLAMLKAVAMCRPDEYYARQFEQLMARAQRVARDTETNLLQVLMYGDFPNHKETNRGENEDPGRRAAGRRVEAGHGPTLRPGEQASSVVPRELR